jgi:hypothetical protein
MLSDRAYTNLRSHRRRLRGRPGQRLLGPDGQLEPCWLGAKLAELPPIRHTSGVSALAGILQCRASSSPRRYDCDTIKLSEAITHG